MSKASSGSSSDNGGYYGGYYYGEGYGGGYGEGPGPQGRSLKDYLLILRERIWWLVVTVMVVFLAAALYTVNSPKEYRSTATLEILRERLKPTQFEEFSDSDVRTPEDLNTQVDIMRGVVIAETVDQMLKGAERRRFLAPYQEGLDPTLRGEVNALEILFRNRSIDPQRNSRLVNVSYAHRDPQVAANIANLFAEAFLDFDQSKNVKNSIRAIEELQEQVDQETVKIKEMEQELANFKERHDTTSFDRDEDVDNQQLMQINERLEEDRRIYDIARARWGQIETAREEDRPVWELSFIARDRQVETILSQIAQQEIGLASLEKKFRAKHPRMIAALESLGEARAQLRSAVNTASSGIYLDYQQAQANFESSQKRLTEKRQEIIVIDRLRPEYNELLRNLGISQDLYEHYYSRLQQALSSVVMEGANAEIIDRARPSAAPFRPRVVVNLGAGLLVGMALGFGLVFALALMDDKIKTAYDIESTLGVPLIGIVPRISRIDTLQKARVVADNHDRHTVEAFRAIHSTLKLNEESRNAKVMLTTSTIPSEGKSFITTNMAITFAAHGERVIVLDGDLRMPNVAKSLNLEQRKGVLTYLAGDCTLDEAILPNCLPNLDILVSGGRSKNPTQLLSSDGFAAMIQELRTRYDRVMIDSPPLAPVSDALNILPLVDGIIYVIRFNTVKRKTAALNVKRLNDSNVPLYGAVLNNINTSVAGYYYSHYYDRSYSSYYVRDDHGAFDPRAEGDDRLAAPVASDGTGTRA